MKPQPHGDTTKSEFVSSDWLGDTGGQILSRPSVEGWWWWGEPEWEVVHVRRKAWSKELEYGHPMGECDEGENYMPVADGRWAGPLTPPRRSRSKL